MRKIKFMLVAFVSIFMVSFIPNVYAEDGNYYELKFYEKHTLDDFSDEENALMVLILKQEDLLHYSAVYSKENYYNLDNKLLFTLDFSSSDTNGIIEIGNNVTFQDSIEYIFTNDEKTQLEENYPELSGYRGVKLMFAEEPKEECTSVCIESIALDSKSDKTEIISKPKYQDLTVKFDIKFRELNDYAKYKVVINNATDEDYIISEKKAFGDSQYITYEYNYEGDNRIAKKNSKTVMYITTKYNQKVPDEKFNNGIFTETNNMVIVLGDDKGIMNVFNNPNTGHNLLAIGIVLLIVLGLSLVLYKTTKNKKYLSILIIGLALLPVSIYAIEKIQINVESKIQISQSSLEQFSLYVGWSCGYPDYSEWYQKATHYQFEEGMTWREWEESEYNVDHMKIFRTKDSSDIKFDYTGYLLEYVSPELIECHKQIEPSPSGHKSQDALDSCAWKSEPQRHFSTSLILNDGLYNLNHGMPC